MQLAFALLKKGKQQWNYFSYCFLCFFSLYSLPCQRKPLIEELDDNLESKEKPLIQELAKKDDLSVRHHSPSRPVIEQINERFTRLNKLSRSLIEEPDTATDFTARGENSKPLIMEIPPEGAPDGTARPNANTAEPRESGLAQRRNRFPVIARSFLGNASKTSWTDWIDNRARATWCSQGKEGFRQENERH